MKKVKIVETSMSSRSKHLSPYALDANRELINLLKRGWEIQSTIPLAWNNSTGAIFGVIHILTIDEDEVEE